MPTSAVWIFIIFQGKIEQIASFLALKIMTVIKNLVSNKVATRAKNSNSKPINTNRSYNIFTSTNEIFSRSKTFIFDSLKLLQGNLDISRRLLKTSSRVSAIDEGRGPLELQGMQLLTKFHAIMDSKLQQPNKVVAATPSASANIALTNFQGVSKLKDKEVILGRIPFTASDLRSALQVKYYSPCVLW